MSQRNVQLVERFYRDLWNRFDKSQIPELLADDIEFRGSLGQHKRGHAEFAEYVDFVWRVFPDFHNEVEDIVSQGNKSFARLLYTGTHRGELFGVAPTGRRVQYAGAALFTFRVDQIASVWVLGDIHGLLEQLRRAVS
jgi:steroid delta-isomerase-like uncharacterized protein